MRADRPDVTSGREAKVSVQHSVAVAFLYGAAGLAQYTDQCVAEPAVLDFRRNVAIEEDANIPVEAAFVSVQATDGSRFECHVTKSRGTMARPMSDAELETKFRDLAQYGAPTIDPERLIAAVWAIEEQHDVARTIGMAAR
jgi:2-methylcitrate dehydratase PrpD